MAWVNGIFNPFRVAAARAVTYLGLRPGLKIYCSCRSNSRFINANAKR